MPRRGRSLQLGLAVWTVLGVGCLPGSEVMSPTAAPRAALASVVHDFGEVPLGVEVRHAFPVTNRGRQPLTLQPARTECACKATVSPGGTLAAGEAGWVEVAFDTMGATGGERVRTVTIDTNDPQTPELVLALRGRVVADVTVSPEKVFFGHVPRGVRREITVDVETAAGVTVEKVRKESPRFDLRVVRLAAPRAGIRIHVILRPQHHRGPFDDLIVVTTDSARQPSVDLPVLALVE